jgi:hypothetical protein
MRKNDSDSAWFVGVLGKMTQNSQWNNLKYSGSRGGAEFAPMAGFGAKKEDMLSLFE